MKNRTTPAARRLAALCLFMLTASLLLTVLPLAGEEEVYDRTVRLHVLAHSDSEADQAVKLRVRDRIVSLAASLAADCTDADEALAALTAGRSALRQAADEVLAEAGVPYRAEVLVGAESYPTRIYGSVALPAGSYRSVRIVLGDGRGHNWWCILFPPLCTAAAGSETEQLAEAGFTPGQIRALSRDHPTRYVLKFRLLEVLRSLWEER